MISKILRLLAVAGLTALFVSGCSTTDTRIQKNQAVFNEYPKSVQDAIRNNRIEIGFTPDQVRMAMGEPSRSYTRTTATGTSLVWAYASKSGTFSFGVGVGGGSGGVGGGVGVSTGTDRPDDKLRVIFENERVMTVEQTKN